MPKASGLRIVLASNSIKLPVAGKDQQRHPSLGGNDGGIKKPAQKSRPAK
jgi:hypothetical protein